MATKLPASSAASTEHVHSKTAQAPAGAPAHSAPRLAKVATSPKPKAHHAKLVSKKCEPRCEVGTLLDLVSQSLRQQRKLDPPQAGDMLADDEEFGLTLDPLVLHIFGLRRERSISNRFDDLMVVLYQPPLLKEDNHTLDDEHLVSANLADAQIFIQAVEANSPPLGFAAPPHWPTPGMDVSCPMCGHWKLLTFPVTTDPGYEKKAHTRSGFDDETKLPDGIGAIIPSIYSAKYRLGLHKGARSPPTSYPALELTTALPARRRYPVRYALEAARRAFEAAGQGRELRKIIAAEAKKDPAGQRDAYAAAEENVRSVLGVTHAHATRFKKAVQEAFEEENQRRYLAAILAAQREAARDVLSQWVAHMLQRIGQPEGDRRHRHTVLHYEEIIRVECHDGTEREDLEAKGQHVTAIEVIDLPSEQPMQLGIQLELESSSTTPAGHPVLLGSDDVLVLRQTIVGANIHTSQLGEKGALNPGREVDNYSEGCQVFRSPSDFHVLLRLAQLSKRARCSNRIAACRGPLSEEIIAANLGDKIRKYFSGFPKDPDATSAKKRLTERLDDSWKPPEEYDPRPNDAAERTEAYRDLHAAILKESLGVLGDKNYASEQAKNALEVAQKRVSAKLGSGCSEDEVRVAVTQVTKEFRAVVEREFNEWLDTETKSVVQDLLKNYGSEHFEPCDFGTCGVRFDYILAQLSEGQLRTLVKKIGGTWQELFPESS